VVCLKDRLNIAFEYEEGYLIWKCPSSIAVKIGSVAGTASDKGYILITFGGVSYKAHRLIWTMFNGDIPEGCQIDHINGMRHDNRLENLRLTTNQGNALNRHSVLAMSGVRGVNIEPSGRYRARVKFNGKHINAGTFDTPQEACKAYEALRTKLFETL
jgi:hypothetical protein